MMFLHKSDKCDNGNSKAETTTQSESYCLFMAFKERYFKYHS